MVLSDFHHAQECSELILQIEYELQDFLAAFTKIKTTMNKNILVNKHIWLQNKEYVLANADISPGQIISTRILELCKWLCMHSIKWNAISSKFVTGL